MNEFTIIQTEKQTQLAVSVHRNAEINDIRLARARVNAARPGDALKESIAISMDVRSKDIECVGDTLLIEVSFRLTGSRKNEKNDQTKGKDLVSVECAFEVDYKLRPGFSPTEEQIKAFKDGNAIFNCWPYCRQHVQDMLQRLGYPSPTLPFLRVHTKRRENQKLPKPE
jgi:hypothetical protein